MAANSWRQSAATNELQRIERLMQSASSYEEWRDLGHQHDEKSGAASWKETEASSLYDYGNIRTRLDRLRDLRQSKNDRGLLFALNEGVHGNMGGMGKPVLHNRAKIGTKALIEEYIDEICRALIHFSPKRFKGVPFRERHDFFMRASQCYGRSALMLSGGGALGNFHLGVIKVLLEQQLLPIVISGSSAGAFMAAVVGTHTDDELLAMYKDGSIVKSMSQGAGKFKFEIVKGELQGIDEVEKGIARVVPNLTFQEAYEKTGRAINISISGAEPQQNSRLLNAITSPNVLIRSAVMASSAIPGLFPPVMLKARNDGGRAQAYLPSRRWVDGSFSQDLPAKRLARLYGVNHFIVSQVNPAVLPLLSDPKLSVGLKDMMGQSAKSMSKYFLRSALNFFRHRQKTVGPRMAVTLNTLHALVDQDYTGDINIFPSFRYYSPRKLISAITEEEVAYFVDEGQRATWPKVSSIRTNTKIGRTLDGILAKLEIDSSHWLHTSPKTAASVQDTKKEIDNNDAERKSKKSTSEGDFKDAV